MGIIATGTDNLDLEACRRHGVAVANVPGYSTDSVAQMTFSLLLAICQCAERYNRAVKQGCWQLDIPESIGLLPQMELYGKTYGVYGYGSIGRQSARIARAFGMEVLCWSAPAPSGPEYAADGVEFVEFDTLLRRCDVLSLHCPATPRYPGAHQCRGTGQGKARHDPAEHRRGALVDEEAVADALQSGQLAYYGADAFGTEPLRRTAACAVCPMPSSAAHRLDHQRGPAAADRTLMQPRTWLGGLCGCRVCPAGKITHHAAWTPSVISSGSAF